jgi:hypothetical protein
MHCFLVCHKLLRGGTVGSKREGERFRSPSARRSRMTLEP